MGAELMPHADRRQSARRPAAEPDERRSGGVVLRRAAGVLQPKRSVSDAIGGAVIVQRLTDDVILAELAWWDLSAEYGSLAEVSQNDIVMAYFRAFDTVDELKEWLEPVFGPRLTAPGPLPPPQQTPLPGALTPTTTTPATPTVTSAPPPKPKKTPKPSAPSSASAPPPGPAPVAVTPYFGLSYGSAASKGAKAPTPAYAAPASSGPSQRAQTIIAKFESWLPSQGHSGCKDLSLTAADLDVIQQHAENDGRYYVVRGPGDGAAYSDFMQLKIIHGKMPAGSDGQKPTFHISYTKI
jgi:hypothetical protein